MSQVEQRQSADSVDASKRWSRLSAIFLPDRRHVQSSTPQSLSTVPSRNRSTQNIDEQTMMSDALAFLKGISAGIDTKVYAEGIEATLFDEGQVEPPSVLSRFAAFSMLPTRQMTESRILLAPTARPAFASVLVLAHTRNTSRDRKTQQGAPGRRESLLQSSGNSMPPSLMQSTEAIDGESTTHIPLVPPKESCSYGRELRHADKSAPVAHRVDDPSMQHGKETTVLQFPGYMVSIACYSREEDRKRDLNARFRELFPHVDLTLSKLRSLKRDMVEIGIIQFNLELSTIAMCHAYYERLVYRGLINKPNRKLVAACCLVLAYKFNTSTRPSITKHRLKKLGKLIDDKWRVDLKEILSAEVAVYAALKFQLTVEPDLLDMHRRRIQQMLPDRT